MGWERVEVRRDEGGEVDEVVARSADDALCLVAERLDVGCVQVRLRVGGLGVHLYLSGGWPAHEVKSFHEAQGVPPKAGVRFTVAEREDEVARVRARVEALGKHSGVRMELRLRSPDRSLSVRLDSRGPTPARVVELEEVRRGLARTAWLIVEAEDPRAHVSLDVQEDV
jgi:hypothetical protein